MPPGDPFDEMLRAGLISPGSQPRVESRPARPAVQPTGPTSQILDEERRSEVVEIQEGLGLDYPLVLILSPDEKLQIAASAAIRHLARLAASSFAPFPDDSQLTEAALLLVDAAYPNLTELLTLGPRVVVLARDEDRDRAIAAIGDRNIQILRLPFQRTHLLRTVRDALWK